MALQSSQRKYDARTLMNYELTFWPASMFDSDGTMRVAKAKSVLKNNLKVEAPIRQTIIDASFLDGCALLWAVTWPTGGTVKDFLVNFRHHIRRYTEISDIYLVFDRYIDGSTKESTRNERDQGASRVFVLRTATKLPSQKAILSVSRNKKQLIDLITEELVSNKDDFNRKLVITGNHPTPVQIVHGVLSQREDMTITHEEADTMLVQQLAFVGPSNAVVVPDDTNVRAYLCSCVTLCTIETSLVMS